MERRKHTELPECPRHLHPLPLEGSGQDLVEILADMLRSALAWEQEHGEVGAMDAAESEDCQADL